MSEYIVKSGDTLWGIAKLNNKTVSSIQQANGYDSNTIIRPGQKIIIPDDAGLDTVSFSSKIPVTSNQTENKDSKTYSIKKGDNFAKVEKEYWLKSGQLQKANPKIKPDKLKIGQKINIPEKEYYLKSVDENDEKFKSLLSKILKDEGGFKPAEKDGSDVKTNKGITQEVYNQYLKEKAYDNKTSAELKDVKNITEKEVKEIYYNYYYIKSGADKENDIKTAYWKMDTAINCGVGKAKELSQKCGSDNEKWYNARKEYYNKIVQNNNSKKKFLVGWLNRIQRIKDLEIV